MQRELADLAAGQWVGAVAAAQELLPFLDLAVYGCGSSPPPRFTAKQVHGTVVAEVGAAATLADWTPPTGDGLWTQRRQVRLGVCTADCLPLVLADPGTGFLAVVHAGWRGLVAGVVRAAVAAAPAVGELYAFLGPCIGRAAFEVGPEVLAAFIASPQWTPPQQLLCLEKGRSDRWHLDLAQAAFFTLCNHGLAPARIVGLRSCTWTAAAQWYSYRRTPALLGQNHTVAALVPVS